jgi:hypothetical protein
VHGDYVKAAREAAAPFMRFVNGATSVWFEDRHLFD